MNKRELAIYLKQRTRVNGECWEWTGGLHGVGYGSVSRKKTHPSGYTHRAMYEAVIGDIPHGMYVLHSCDNRRCINPEHLRVGTHLENIKDMQSKGRHRGGSLPNEINPICKFSNEIVRAIRAERAAGIQKRMTEIRYGVSESQYYRIVKHQSRVLEN